MINTVSLFLAMAKMWDDHVKELPLPFSFDEFYDDAKRQIVSQSEDLSTSNKLSVFFDTISMLYAQGQIITGREFDISTEKRVTLRISRTETEEKHWDGEEKKLLFLIINDVVQIYQKLHSSESLKLNSLRMYLKDHPAYIGAIKGHRFIYQVESWETDPATGINRKVVQKAERNTSCIALDYKILEAMGIDLERFKTPEQVPLDLKVPENLSDQSEVQNELPF